MHPVLFHLGPIPVRAYGTLILIGFFVALRYAMAEARKLSDRRDADSRAASVTPDRVFDMAIFGLFAGLVGTRIVYVALHWHLFADNPIEVFKIWTGGLSFIGAPIFGFGFVWLYCRRHGLPFRVVADIGAPGFALAYTFGRIGCFLNGCCHGSACGCPWAVRFHTDGATDLLTPPSHPAQLYAAAMSIGIFWILHRLRRRPHPDGSILITYFILYATYRFINDFFRAGATSKVVLWGLTDGQVAAIVAVPLLSVWLWKLYHRRR